jgi:hypothetical protein
VISPADGSWVVTPDKIWYKAADATGDVDDAFAMHEVPNVTTQLMKIINTPCSWPKNRRRSR